MDPTVHVGHVACYSYDPEDACVPRSASAREDTSVKPGSGWP